MTEQGLSIQAQPEQAHRMSSTSQGGGTPLVSLRALTKHFKTDHVIVTALPARFGGSPLDYQLVEEEDEQAVVAEVLDALRRVDATGIPTAVAWDQAQTLRVRRQEPIRTGKLLPLHVGAVGAERTPSTSEGSAS